MEVSTLDLTFESGKTITIHPTGYHLKLDGPLMYNELGSYKVGTFKINHADYKSWEPIATIIQKLDDRIIGECTIVDETPITTTPRTITYKVRVDWRN
ncbi:hypothetical protein V2I49_12355 [Pseudomonas viridiflava]|uniref:hypothetical protein n=1 Tax=Pseudomonas TaxID=286 RepID=UPI0016559EAE|nr:MULTISPECIES: hypothetical protein [Pseudomonas]MBC8800132.1 hypothetical protein [Pseudomonas congelans]MBP1147102.1 hypothetical protein [Pseudomonas sp. PvP027]MEE4076129.1 hypothetical protein [Pseudomonas viridiflava]